MSATQERRLLRSGVLGAFVVAVCLLVLGITVLQGWRQGDELAITATAVKARLKSAMILEASGQFGAAQNQLAPLLQRPHAPGFRAAEWLSWRLNWVRMMGLARAAPGRAQARALLLRQTAALIQAGAWTQTQWHALAHGALALGRLRLAARAWMQAARDDPADAIHDEYGAVQVWAADDQAARAGRMCLRLADSARSISRQDQLFRQGVALLEGARGAVDALGFAQKALRRFSEWRSRRAIVLCVARVAMAAGRPAAAESVLAGALTFREAR